MNQADYLILGGGVSGLACLRALQAAGKRGTLLEAGAAVGGLSRSEKIGRFTFDQAGHMLHLARASTPAEIPFAGLDNAHWEKIRKRAFVLLGGKLVRAPVQYFLSDLDEPLRSECAASYDARPALPPEETANFRDYLISGFGKKLAEIFLIPQNEKNLSVPLENLSVDSVKRFFPLPREALIRQGLKGDTGAAEEYNSWFWYPKRGGIGLLAEGLARTCEGILPGHRAAGIHLETKTLRCANGSEWRWKHLITSLPLKEFCLLTQNESLREEARKLSQGSVLVFNLALKRPLEGSLKNVHWVYTPEKQLPFYRIGIYSNLSASQSDPGASRLYVETGLPETHSLAPFEEASIRERVEDALEKLGWLRKDDIVHSIARLIPCAYTHYTPARKSAVSFILGKLKRSEVHAIGRYGRWEYSSMEDSIYSGIETAKELS